MPSSSKVINTASGRSFDLNTHGPTTDSTVSRIEHVLIQCLCGLKEFANVPGSCMCFCKRKSPQVLVYEGEQMQKPTMKDQDLKGC